MRLCRDFKGFFAEVLGANLVFYFLFFTFVQCSKKNDSIEHTEKYDYRFVLKPDPKIDLKKIENKKFVKNKYGIYVINLDRDKERMAKISGELVREFGKNSFKRIEAVDGRNLSPELLKEKVSPDLEKFLGITAEQNKGSVACYLSHYNTWKEFLESDNEFALIFEDDILLNPKYEGHVKDIIALAIKKKDKWDYLHLENGNFEARKNLDYSLNGDDYFYVDNLYKDIDFVIKKTASVGNGMYMINRAYARNLVKYGLPRKMPGDFFTRRTWEFDGNMRFISLNNGLGLQSDGHFTSSAAQINTVKDRVNFEHPQYKEHVKGFHEEHLSEIELYAKKQIELIQSTRK